ncbi:ABC transporter permease [Bacillus massilinigeriensis]|uniref:ABC transporter permease n=1 Tax=Bacillus mediterraneensis TaxID=1805474 RepID=UPI0008F7E7D1|nr:ABC transporter permease [Bacillus mediterraneensis]
MLVIYLMKKTIRMATLLLAISFLSFLLVKNSPLDPVQAYIGADMANVSHEQREQIAKYWGLDEPVMLQYTRWAGSLLSGDMGTSMIYREPVAIFIAERFQNSIILMLTAWFLSGMIGFVLGSLAAMNKGAFTDHVIKWYCYTLASTPTFWMGLLVLMVFSVWLGWFPVGLGVPAGKLAEEITLGEQLQHLALPALTLSIVGVGNIALHTRQKLIDVLKSEYITFARARGESGFELFWKHGLRNILAPALMLQFASFSELFGGAVLAEQVFSYPGLGQATVEAGLKGDVPLLLGLVLFSTVFVFIGNLIGDILHHLVDPRMREEWRT